MTGTNLQPLREAKKVGPPLPTTVTTEWPDWLSPSALPAPKPADQLFGLLPAAKKPSRKPLIFSFLIFVALPTMLVAFYYETIASNQYVSEFRFSVSQVSSAVPGAPPPGSSSSGGSSSLAAGLSAIAGGGSVSSGGGQNYLVIDYIKSDQAVRDLLKTIDLRNVYDKSQVDALSRLNKNASFEELANYWRKMVISDYDSVTDIAWVNVRAFDPHDAQRIAAQLVILSEGLVNSVEARANKDVLEAANKEVSRTRADLAQVRSKLLKFRDAEGVIDPTQSVVPANVAQISSVESSLIQLNSRLASNREMAANSPANKSLISQINAARQELARLKDEVGKTRSGDKVLADVIGRYETLNFDLQYQQSMAMSAMQAREQAYANANAQHLFMTPYVQPTVPSTSTYPDRITSILYAGMMAMGVWVVLLLLKRSLDEHA